MRLLLRFVYIIAQNTMRSLIVLCIALAASGAFAADCVGLGGITAACQEYTQGGQTFRGVRSTYTARALNVPLCLPDHTGR